jgi:3-oxoacyl-[acyl-carrier protein] reductase
MDLKNKNIFITGSSRGIGAGIAMKLAGMGAKVTITYGKSKEQAQKIFDELPGEGHLLLPMDINSEDSVKEATESAIAEWNSQIDGLVNNAGITRDQLLLRMKKEDFDDVYTTNLRGSFYTTKMLLKPMMKSRKGSIVNISSVVGAMGNAGQSNYSATKAGLEAFTRSIAKEIGSRGIRVNAVAPGFIQTDMTDVLSDTQKDSLLKDLPLGRLGSVDDIAESVAFLLSDASSYITGHTLHVNGGMFMN